MDRVLELNDGTTLKDSYAIAASGKLWIYVHNQAVSMADLFALLNDPGKTEKITGREYGVETEWTGYTKLFCVRKEDGGFLSAGLNP